MKIKFLLLLLFLAFTGSFVSSQPLLVRWQQTIGGAGNDSLTGIVPTNDGGFIVSGQSNSNISGNKSQNSVQNSIDFWIVKLDSLGQVQWDKTIGGTGTDRAPVVIQTFDGGYLVGGTSKSPISGNKTGNAINNSYDYWVIKLDKTGNIQWNNTIGGIQLDILVSLAQAADSSYLLGGYSYTTGARTFDKNDPNRGSSLWADYWLVKLNKDGRPLEWNRVFGGRNEDVLTSMKATRDGGYILGGYSYSVGPEYEKSENVLGNGDYWMVKVKDSTKIFDKVSGGSLSDYMTDIQETADGGYILGGYSNSPLSFDKSEGTKGVTDYWVVKTDPRGKIIWDKTIGGTGGDYLTSIQQTAERGYILGGYSNSNISGDKSTDSKGLEDYWIVKLDSTGRIIWNKTYGGSGSDKLNIVREIRKNEFILAGTSNSPASGDKATGTVGNSGKNDFWILRLTEYTKQSAPLTKRSVPILVTRKFPYPSLPVFQMDELNAVDIKTLSLKVFPNPTAGIVTLNYTSPANSKPVLRVFDNNGKNISSAQLPGGKGVYRLDLSKWAGGSYFAILSSQKNFVTRIIIKE